MKYNVIVRSKKNYFEAVKDLIEYVELNLELGWKLQGGISITYNNDEKKYVVIQSMIKE